MSIVGQPASYATSLNEQRNPKSGFDHYDHRGASCHDCHAPGANARFELKIEGGFGACLDCHDPTSSRGLPSAKQKVQAFLAGLNTSPSTEANPAARFDHAEHIPPGRENDAATCQACHTGIATAPGTKIGESEFDLDSCKSCHRKDAAGSGVAFGTTPSEFRSRAGGTFPHDKHLSASAFKNDENLAKLQCLACHAPVSDAGVKTYGLKPEPEDYYDSCTECHFHGKNKIVNHGEVDNCAGCHQLGQADMKTNRPRATLERPRSVEFEFVDNIHKFISQGTVDESCSKCHRAKVDRLPSRIGKKRFSHDTHLPPNPKPEDCVACHAAVALTSGPSAKAEDFFAPNLEACASCHKGQPAMPAAPLPVTRDVPVFPHDLHLSAGALEKDDSLRTKGCLACHVPPQAGNPDVGTLKEAMDCTSCHSHERRPNITGQLGQVEAGQCASCHAAGVPRKGEPVMDVRTTLLGSKDRMIHPSTPDCTDCHRVVKTEAPRMRESNLGAHVLRNKQFQGPYHKSFPEPAGKACTSCHWADLWDEPARRGVANVSLEVIKQIGDELSGFPGGSR